MMFQLVDVSSAFNLQVQSAKLIVGLQQKQRDQPWLRKLLARLCPIWRDSLEPQLFLLAARPTR
jgi:hypothetical protein